jgi:3-phosphoshikimate 1-carboxyvinyltransferase
MALPDLIEIVPLTKPIQAEITVPGSKSITNRALVLAALTDGEITLQGALWSEDTQVMVECLQELGFMVNVGPDPDETCNRTITVYGRGGIIPAGGTETNPLELFVGNAGTTARFLVALVCLGRGVYRLHGVPRMHERPQAALFKTLRELGYRIEASGDKLPALIYGGGPRAGHCRVSIEESSQFASALLLCAQAAGWRVEVFGENAEESPYVQLTLHLVEQFEAERQIAATRSAPNEFRIEPDASSGSYFWAAAWLLAQSRKYTVVVDQWPVPGWQIDASFLDFLPLPDRISRHTQLGDSIMTAIILAPFHMAPTKFTDLGRLRVQECERVTALRTQLTQCGAKVVESGDTLEVFPSSLHGATIESYNDHRMAMCFAILGLKVPGIKIKNPACVKKTFPNFFQKLATAPPRGLGVTILEGTTGRRLGLEELFAE